VCGHADGEVKTFKRGRIQSVDVVLKSFRSMGPEDLAPSPEVPLAGIEVIRDRKRSIREVESTTSVAPASAPDSAGKIQVVIISEPVQPFEGLVEGDAIGFEIVADASKIDGGHSPGEPAKPFAPWATALRGPALKRLSLLANPAAAREISE
jgi:hypothetical protein